MSRSERQRLILELLQKCRFISVAELSQLLYTSPSSIRRDLSVLEAQQLVRRNHGGVTLYEDERRALNFEVRIRKNIVGKKRIAKKASALLKDNLSVMLDGSSSAMYLIPYLKEHKGITVFSNNIKTVSDAIEAGIRTYCIGGEAIDQYAVLSGSYADEMAEKLYVDILFFSSQCLSDEGEITDSSESENRLRKIMLRNAAKTVFLCDGDKIGKRALHKLCSVSEVDYAFFEQELYTQKFSSIS